MEISKQAIIEGRSLTLYEDSEQADQDKEENVLDYLWQSLFDVYKLSVYGIIEDVDQADIDAVGEWLCKYQQYTKKYQDIGIPF